MNENNEYSFLFPHAASLVQAVYEIMEISEHITFAWEFLDEKDMQPAYFLVQGTMARNESCLTSRYAASLFSSSTAFRDTLFFDPPLFVQPLTLRPCSCCTVPVQEDHKQIISPFHSSTKRSTNPPIRSTIKEICTFYATGFLPDVKKEFFKSIQNFFLLCHIWKNQNTIEFQFVNAQGKEAEEQERQKYQTQYIHSLHEIREPTPLSSFFSGSTFFNSLDSQSVPATVSPALQSHFVGDPYRGKLVNRNLSTPVFTHPYQLDSFPLCSTPFPLHSAPQPRSRQDFVQTEMKNPKTEREPSEGEGEKEGEGSIQKTQPSTCPTCQILREQKDTLVNLRIHNLESWAQRQKLSLSSASSVNRDQLFELSPFIVQCIKDIVEKLKEEHTSSSIPLLPSPSYDCLSSRSVHFRCEVHLPVLLQCCRELQITSAVGIFYFDAKADLFILVAEGDNGFVGFRFQTTLKHQVQEELKQTSTPTHIIPIWSSKTKALPLFSFGQSHFHPFHIELPLRQVAFFPKLATAQNPYQTPQYVQMNMSSDSEYVELRSAADEHTTREVIQLLFAYQQLHKACLTNDLSESGNEAAG